MHLVVLGLSLGMKNLPVSWETFFCAPQSFPGDSVVKNLPANAGDSGDVILIPELERSPGEGKGNSIQYSCLENPMERGAWRATVHGVTKELDTT